MAHHHVLQRGQPLKTNGATRMQLIVGDPNLGTQAILKAICKSGAGIDHHTRTIDFSQETIGMLLILGNDRIRVLTTIMLNMIHCLIKTLNSLNR